MIGISGLRHRSLAIDRLAIGRGVTSVIGRNGSGKTTFLRLLAGIDEPESGTISIGGKKPRETATGWVAEYPDRNLLFSTVSDEIASALRFSHVSCREADERTRTICETMSIIHLADRRIRDLSGGEKALVAVAAALVSHPQLVVLDEFDSHLDPARSRQIMTAIRSCGAEYVVHCTQKMETAAAGDGVVFLERGRVAHAGPPREVFGRLRSTPFCPRLWRSFA